MTKRSLWRAAGSLTAFYGLTVAVGIYLRMRDPLGPNVPYVTFKDLVGLLIAVPAALFAVAFQRRASYLQALRNSWRSVLEGVHSARSYTYVEHPTSEAYARVLAQLSIGVDEMRGVFRNLNVPNTPAGWYPFEPLKQIHDVIRELGSGERATPERRAAARRTIRELWRPVRDQMLLELDRDFPTHHHAGLLPQRTLPQPAHVDPST